jgi:hypothetical protein
MHDCLLGAGVTVRVNAADPGRWSAIRVESWDEHSRPLLQALIGAPAVGQLNRRLKSEWPQPEPDLEWIDFEQAGASALISLRAAEPWLRVAAVDALDRWLYLPLDQVLIDAERAVSRVRAIQKLPAGRARADALVEALRLARAVAWPFADYLDRLAAGDTAVPESLRKVLNDLVDGYKALAAELPEPDQDLQSVVTAGGGGLDRLPTGVDQNLSRANGGADEPCPPGTTVAATSLIDPRQLPARLVHLSAQPAAGEVRVYLERLNGLDAAVVEVPAYGPGKGVLRGGSASDQLALRLIDKLTGRDVDGALLTLEDVDGQAVPVFRGVLNLPGGDPGRFRVDVFDGTRDRYAAGDDDPDLLAVRRTTTRLADRRRSVAEARLGLSIEDEPPDGRTAQTVGAGDLLVAEVAAAAGQSSVSR